jgi:hypothetical protein
MPQGDTTVLLVYALGIPCETLLTRPGLIEHDGICDTFRKFAGALSKCAARCSSAQEGAKRRTTYKQSRK